MAAENPRTLGFIHVGKGGAAALAVELGLKWSAASQVKKHLEAWEEAGYLSLFWGRKADRYPPLIGVQVPWMTLTLLALAEMNTVVLSTGDTRPRNASQAWDKLEPAEKFPPSQHEVNALVEAYGRSPKTPVPVAMTQRECRHAIDRLDRAQ